VSADPTAAPAPRTPRTAAIVPVKRFTRAKQRLAPSMAAPLRAELAQAMVADVLAALARTAAVTQTIVVSNEPAVAEIAPTHRALILADTAERGQSAAAALGIAHARAVGFERVLCVPGDCPALDPAELRGLLEAPQEPYETDGEPDVRRGETVQKRGARARARVRARGAGLEEDLPDAVGTPSEVVVVPDRHGTGTNALLLTPPDAIAPAFGPDSCARHIGLAQAAGAAVRVERLPSLLLDIDTGEDLAVLRERLAGEHARAPRTRAALGIYPEPCLASPPAA
jgi:2-phospho-L-lactate/phosphoenolpyruvate guanylyltransferase